ncbi:MAG: SHOCT domain-containing protein [Burkholderiales bacterium]|nr:SHOCT domain-containing protein [Burkholderiales bacterium]MCA3230319.1 SHOCT domain-containing protein [Burkholderiales bacterium]
MAFLSTPLETDVRSLTIAGAMALALLAGCASNDVVRARVDVTVGQQLIDLKKARDAGALTADEYDRQRKRLIDSVR